MEVRRAVRAKGGTTVELRHQDRLKESGKAPWWTQGERGGVDFRRALKESGEGEHFGAEITIRYIRIYPGEERSERGRDQGGVQKGGEGAREHLGVEVLRDHVCVLEG